MKASSKREPAVLDEACGRFSLDRDNLRQLEGSDSYLYAGSSVGQDVVLRISPSSHRGADEIKAEVEWVNYLADQGVSVCRAIPSCNGALVEELGTPADDFLVAAFLSAPGGPVDEHGWEPALFRQMGQMIGQMHVLTKAFVPSDPSVRRAQWSDDVVAMTVPLAATQALHERLVRDLRELPRDRDCYGLVHLDFHRGNFFVDRGQIYLFDFYDCHYSWFVDDIAMALFYAVPHDCSSPADKKFASRFLRHLLRGYRTHNEITADMLTQIPLFLKRRELHLYTHISRHFSDDDLDAWATSFMNNRKAKIDNGAPYVDLDFAVF